MSGRWEAFLSPERRRELAQLGPKARLVKSCYEGVLHRALSQLLGISAHRIQLQRTEKGKPFFEASIGFSVSHAEEHVVLAFARREQVGIDLESSSRYVDVDALVEGFFPESERARLLAVPSPARAREVLRTFTCFEALVKATGEGLTIPADDYESLARGLVCSEVELGADWICSVVTDAPECRIRVVPAERLLEP